MANRPTSARLSEPSVIRRYLAPLPRGHERTEQIHARLKQLGDLRDPLGQQPLWTVDHRGVLRDANQLFRDISENPGDLWRVKAPLKQIDVDFHLSRAIGTSLVAASKLENPKPWARDFNSAMGNLHQHMGARHLLDNDRLPIYLTSYDTEEFTFPHIGDEPHPPLTRLFISGFALHHIDLDPVIYLPRTFTTPMDGTLARLDKFHQVWSKKMSRENLTTSELEFGFIQGFQFFEDAYAGDATPKFESEAGARIAGLCMANLLEMAALLIYHYKKIDANHPIIEVIRDQTNGLIDLYLQKNTRAAAIRFWPYASEHFSKNEFLDARPILVENHVAIWRFDQLGTATETILLEN